MGRKHRSPAEDQSRAQKKRANRVLILSVLVLVAVFLVILTRTLMQRTTSEEPLPKAPPGPSAYEFKKQGELQFFSHKRGPLAMIEIEVARDEALRELGLMYREHMAENQGMLFLFEDEAQRSFWMKNTIISLDMIFINGKKEIVTIHKHTAPYLEDSYVSTAPVQYVIEVNAGFADRHGITLGDHVSWHAF